MSDFIASVYYYFGLSIIPGKLFEEDLTDEIIEKARNRLRSMAEYERFEPMECVKTKKTESGYELQFRMTPKAN